MALNKFEKKFAEIAKLDELPLIGGVLIYEKIKDGCSKIKNKLTKKNNEELCEDVAEDVATGEEIPVETVKKGKVVPWTVVPDEQPAKKKAPASKSKEAHHETLKDAIESIGINPEKEEPVEKVEAKEPVKKQQPKQSPKKPTSSKKKVNNNKK